MNYFVLRELHGQTCMTNAVPLSVVNDKYMDQQYLFRAFSNLTEL